MKGCSDFIIITSSSGRIDLLIGTLDVMKNLETTSRVPHRYCTTLTVRRHKFELGHIDKLRMLRIRVYWGARLEPVDPDVTSICHVLD